MTTSKMRAPNDIIDNRQRTKHNNRNRIHNRFYQFCDLRVTTEQALFQTLIYNLKCVCHKETSDDAIHIYLQFHSMYLRVLLLYCKKSTEKER